MGIMDFIKTGVKEMMIARPDSAKSQIIYKHPENTIPKYSQLTVDADEAAVFFRDGAFVGVLKTAGAGQRHTLDAGNIPFLSNLVDSFTGGNIFVTDLYFVTMRAIRETKFGGPLQTLKDPELEITVSPRVFGNFAWKVSDPTNFIVNYTGMTNELSNDKVESWITTKFMNAVKKTVPEFVIKKSIDVQSLGAYHDELGQNFLTQCDDLSEIGIQFLELGDFSINFSDEDLKRIQEAQARYADIKVKKKAKDELSQGNFMQYAAAEAMMGAGAGMAKGGGGDGAVQGGAGVGMGFAMAQMFGQNMAQGMAQGYPQGSGHGGGGHGGSSQGGAVPAAGGVLVTCPACSAKVAPGKFCSACGANLSPQARPCSACGTMLAPGAKFCANCGTAAPQS